MKAKHTPGPWKLSHSGYANAPFVLHVGEAAPNYNRRYPLQGVDWIAEIRDDESPEHPRYEANARLIAAAPEMLEALRDIMEYHPSLKYFEEKIASDRPPIGLEDGEYEAVKKAEAAIRKARGEQ